MNDIKVLKFGTIREDGETLILDGFEFEIDETKPVSSAGMLYAISVYLNKYKNIKITLDDDNE